MPTLRQLASSQPGPVFGWGFHPLSGVPAAMPQNTWSLLTLRDASRALVLENYHLLSWPCRERRVTVTWWLSSILSSLSCTSLADPAQRTLPVHAQTSPSPPDTLTQLHLERDVFVIHGY